MRGRKTYVPIYVMHPCPICGTAVRKTKADYTRLTKTNKPGWQPTCCPSHAAQFSQQRRRNSRPWSNA